MAKILPELQRYRAEFAQLDREVQDREILWIFARTASSDAAEIISPEGVDPEHGIDNGAEESQETSLEASSSDDAGQSAHASQSTSESELWPPC